jgi:acyl-ACP thioesterase
MSESVGPRFGAPFTVRFDEAGAGGDLRASGYLRFAQHVAWMHSTALGFDREWYGSRQLTWLVRAVELRIAGTCPYGSEPMVTTEVHGFRRSWARRHTEIILDGTVTATVEIDWILLGEAGRPVRIPPEIQARFPIPESDTRLIRVGPPPSPESAARRTFLVRRHELDPMRHANNAVYLDWLEDAIALAGAAEAVEAIPRSYRLEFVVPAEPDATLEDAAWPDDAGWWYRLAADGRESLRGRLERGA